MIGKPVAVFGRRITRFCEEWSITDRWWTEEPIRQEYLVVEILNNQKVTIVRGVNEAWRFVQREAR
jgi:hypothetical protein